MTNNYRAKLANLEKSHLLRYECKSHTDKFFLILLPDYLAFGVNHHLQSRLKYEIHSLRFSHHRLRIRNLTFCSFVRKFAGLNLLNLVSNLTNL